MLTLRNGATLFRKESVRQAAGGLDGEVWIGTSGAWKFASAFVILVIVGILIFAAQASFSRHESAVGRLVPKGGIIRVVARAGGTITQLKVKEGARVQIGEVLAEVRLTPDDVSENGGALVAATNAEAAAVAKSGQIGRHLLNEELRTLENQRAFIKDEQRMNQELRVNLEKKEKIVRDDVSRFTELQKRGYLTQASIDNKMAEVLSAQQAILQNESAMHSLSRQLSEVESKIHAMPSRVDEQSSSRNALNAAMRQKLAQVGAQTRESIIAPISGVVASIQTEVGQGLSNGAVILILTPDNNVLEAELFLPSRAIGFVKEGHSVALQYQAFPYQRFGVADGVVTVVSKSIIVPSDAPALGMVLQEPVFKVRVALAKQTMDAYGDAINLQPGMLLKANIVLERRSLIKLIFDPLYAVGARS